MATPIINIEFISKLVSAHDAVKGITAPISDFASLQGAAYKALRQSPDKTIFDACNNEFIRFCHLMCLGMKQRVIPGSWDNRNVSDWMYLFSKQIWAQNAKQGTFGPVRFRDESEVEWQERRSLGAGNTLPKVEQMIRLIESCREAFAAMVVSGRSASVVGSTQAALEGSSLGASCGMLMHRTSQIASGQVTRTDKLLQVLNKLYDRLVAIAETRNQ